MKLKEGAPERIKYKLDVGDGRFVLTETPREIVAEYAHRAESYAYDESDQEFGLVLDGRMRVPRDLFEEEPGDPERFAKLEADGPKPRRRAAKPKE